MLRLYVALALCALGGAAVAREPAPRFEAAPRPLYGTVVAGNCPDGQVHVKMPLGWYSDAQAIPPRVRPSFRCVRLAEGVSPVVGDDVKLATDSGQPTAVDVRRPR